MNFGSRAFLYAEGHTHREAADLLEEVESSEAVAMLFAVLPFAGEESDAEEVEEMGSGKSAGEIERDEGMVIELSQTGPPTRRLKPPMPTIGMNIQPSLGMVCLYMYIHVHVGFD